MTFAWAPSSGKGRFVTTARDADDLYQRPLGGTQRRYLAVMAGLVPAIHGLRVDPAEVVDASLRWHDGDHAPKSRFQRRLVPIIRHPRWFDRFRKV